MKKTKFLVSLILAFTVLVTQAGAVLAAPAPITGTVQVITLDKDLNTGITTVLVTVLGDGTTQTVCLSLESAILLGLVVLNADGSPVINELVLNQTIEIDPGAVILNQGEDRHPVGNALATFFSDVVDYDTIMAAHKEGTGFGVIAQALWLTLKLDGDPEVFLEIIKAKKTGDYSAFVLEDGTTPKNWGQFKKAVLDGDKGGNLGVVMSDKEKDNNGNDNVINNGNNGTGNGNSSNGNGNNGNSNGNNGNGNGNNGNGNNGNGNNGNGNGNNKDKDKDKGKDK